MHNFKIPILMYHSIELMPKSTVMRSLHVSPKSFRFQMWLLNFMGYKALSLKKLKPYLDGKKTGKVVGITFDDGYRNNLINAAPILKKYNFSATCFIVSGLIGTSNTWDLKYNITQRPLMSEKEIKKWLDLGMDIGAHSQTHQDLTNISKEEAQREIHHSKFELEKKFNISISDFCKLVCKIAESSGYHSASSMIRGRVSEKSDRYMLPRIPVNYRTLPHLFLLKLITSYEDKR